MGENKLIFEGFLQRLKDNPDKIAILDGERILTYCELYEKACQVASTLNELGIENRHIFILGNKSSESIVAILGALFAGFTYVALDINQPAARFDHIFSILSPSVLIFTDLNPHLRQELKQMKRYPQYIIDLSRNGIRNELNDANLIDISNKLILPTSYPDEQIAYVLFTSGSTGQPKGVCISHRAASAALLMFQKHVGFKNQDIIANQAALCFDLSVFDIFGALNSGATLCLIPPEVTSLPDRFFQRIEEHKATSLFTTPSTLDFLLANKVYFQSNLFLEKLLLSGEPVSSDLVKKILSFFPDSIEIWNLYGATEIPYALAHRLGKQPDNSVNIFSLRGEGVEIKIRECLSNNHKNALIGELLVKGPAILSGYVNKNNREMLSPLLEEGWYPTGDLASMDAKNQVTLHGRIDRQIKIHGHRVELDEIEFQLVNCPEIQEAAVVFSKESQEIIAYIVLYPTNKTQQRVMELIESFCEKKLPPMFCPSKFVVIENMPYTVTGKKDRKALANTLMI